MSERRLRSNARSSALLCTWLAMTGFGCDRRIEPWVPIEQEPPAAERPVRIPGLASPAPSSPAIMPERVEPGPPAVAPTRDPSLEITGTLTLPSGARVRSDGVVFVIARPITGGPPLAVKRLSSGPFPLDFVLGPGDAMLPGRPLRGKVALSARIDGDGDPLTRGADDWTASSEQPVEPGGPPVQLLLQSSGAPR